MLKAINLNYTYEGSGKVMNQSVLTDEAAGEEGTVIKLTLKNEVTETY